MEEILRLFFGCELDALIQRLQFQRQPMDQVEHIGWRGEIAEKPGAVQTAEW